MAIPLGLELQVVVDNLMWILGIELKSLARTVHIVNSWAISSVQVPFSH